MKALLSCEFNMDTDCIELKLSLIHIYARALLVGVNVGGAGTLVASLASLITVRE